MAVHTTSWETLDLRKKPVTKRLKVPGGWLVAIFARLGGQSMVFYPDPDYVWRPPIKRE